MSRVIFFGSPAAAVASLRAIAAAGHEIAAVYTRPDRPAGRSGDPLPTPVTSAAVEMGLHVATPESLRDPETRATLDSHSSDAFLVVAYGRLLPADVLDMPTLGVGYMRIGSKLARGIGVLSFSLDSQLSASGCVGWKRC